MSESGDKLKAWEAHAKLEAWLREEPRDNSIEAIQRDFCERFGYPLRETADKEPDEPQWTATPPTEPGWYWVATAIGDPVVAEVADNGYAYMVGSPPEEHPRMLQAKGWLWWPVPLRPPEGP